MPPHILPHPHRHSSAVAVARQRNKQIRPTVRHALYRPIGHARVDRGQSPPIPHNKIRLADATGRQLGFALKNHMGSTTLAPNATSCTVLQP